MEVVIAIAVVLLAGVLYYLSEDKSALQDKIDEYTGIKDEPYTDDLLPW